jgi:hypothetical protein
VVDEANQGSARSSDRGHRHSPVGKVIGAVPPEAVESATAALMAAGFVADELEVVTADHLDEFETPLEQPGPGGVLSRFLLSLGDDLDELEKARQELAAGHVLIGVRVEGMENIRRARDILFEHGGHSIIHFGRWTITTFD